MTRSYSAARPRPRSLTRALLSVAVTGALAVLAACSSDDPDPDAAGASERSPADSPTASAPSPSGAPTSPTASPTPSLPRPSDGTNARACADGTCEIRVSGPVSVPLPERFGLGSVEVVSVDDTTVTMIAPLTRSEFSSDGGCSSMITGPGANSGGHVSLTCHSGEKAVVNALDLEVVGIVDQAAVLRLRPAT